MELHFCSVCGISIPLVEVESGVAIGEGGKHLCAEHRPASAAPAATAARAAVEEQDLELLFCANCRVSIPATDMRSGRARKEYGSLLCGVCAQSKPGERAARREAVEAEMAADVGADDPVATRRCAVCSAAVPHSHVVTGKARVTGDRVVCEACAAASDARPVGAGSGSGMKTVGLFALVVFAAGAAGFLGMSQMSVKKELETAATERSDLESALAESRRQIAALETDLAVANEAARGRVEEPLREMKGEVDSEVRGLRAELAGVRGELSRNDDELLRRLAAAEGRLGGLSELVKGLAAQAGARPEVVVREIPVPPRETTKPVDGGGDGGNAPVVKPPNPEVARLSKDLLESDEDSKRFPAASELGRLGDPAAIPALARALLNDKHFLVRRACARSLKALKAWNAVPMLVQALEDKEAYVAAQANYALLDITGTDFGVTQDQSIAKRRQLARSAKKWWDKNQNDPPEGVSLHSADLVQ